MGCLRLSPAGVRSAVLAPASEVDADSFCASLRRHASKLRSLASSSQMDRAFGSARLLPLSCIAGSRQFDGYEPTDDRSLREEAGVVGDVVCC